MALASAPPQWTTAAGQHQSETESSSQPGASEARRGYSHRIRGVQRAVAKATAVLQARVLPSHVETTR
eukprot:CAMPEP_0115671000 /NCGR_PEP_ID=MMETSP0272-20121206/51827_1 /TAXON_ID=71861 /ORGANISM="Scrippsiella trochoidea, Strain CCMP3099" /LENGTH=67 /DNA_ID=CAMNT_0003109759 /DNA_START=413 /DNA_END=613 /DNA_ORIENTATION=+